MGILENLVLGFGLAMDAFAVSLCVGATGRATSTFHRLRPPFYFGFFQFMMPVLGWYGGSWLSGLIGGFDHWVAFGLLAYVGGRMLKSGLSKEAEPSCNLLSHREVLVLSVATSIDALAVGLSLAMLRVAIWRPSIVIGVVTAGLSLAAILLGSRLGERYGKLAEIVGGVVLLGIGLRVLLSHLLQVAA
ncbi:MAG: manganese efflux pump MntP [Anaerolineae bacterium]